MKPKVRYFSGIATNGTTSTNYSVTYCGRRHPACNNNYESAYEIDPELAEHLKEYAWGYEGEATSMLAMDMLLVYGGYDSGWSHHFHESLPPRFPPIPLGTLRKYHKAFASEVVANLPDNWKLTFKQIDRWIHKKEKQCSKEL